ncbi:hypothetical protein IGI04_029228 [Brassica rapa subsp. trilocularis]|uniref:FBD domain-containing protein n=1 Tax=Brassica rapa subsp. trilocularis TaxID=1813537 RepID=A0ABQ7LN84_BRACM|nr:hypothetical protein IGI04_029228 [Brassica rapa subsp. trilocularis]
MSISVSFRASQLGLAIDWISAGPSSHHSIDLASRSNDRSAHQAIARLESPLNHGEYWGDATKLILGVSNVVTLHLSPDSLEGLVHKITNLCGDVCVCDHGKMMRSCCLLSCRVKVLKVYGYEGSCGELNQMRHFLKNLRFVKLDKVKVQEQVNYLSLTNDLTKLLSTASSSNCKIQFI